jgi:hypothetical protein
MVMESEQTRILLERQRCASIVEERCRVLDAFALTLFLRILTQIRSGEEPISLLHYNAFFDEPKAVVKSVSQERERCLKCVDANDVEGVKLEEFYEALDSIRKAIISK